MKHLSSDNQADVIKALTILILKEWSTKFIHLNCNLIKLILQIPRPPFWIYICLFLMALFHPKNFNKRDDFDFDIVNFAFLDGDLKYCETAYERAGKNMFWPLKNSGEVLSKLKDIGYQATSLSTYDFSTLYTTLPHNLIKENLLI